MDEPSNKMRKMQPRPCCYKYQESQDESTISPFTKFCEIRKAPTFVDKTLLLKDLFEGRKYARYPAVLVTAPRRFGKSVNISMIEHFLEKQVDWKTGIEIEDSKTELFADLKIMEHKEFVKKHFGKYAILKVSYLCSDSITNKREALNFYKGVIRDAYKKHSYLCNSSKLDERDQNICKEWCDKKDYLKNDDALVSVALKYLSEFLHLHYEGKLKVFLLLDEYDSIFYKAMTRIKDREVLACIIDNGISMLSNLVKDNDYIKGAFLTGISHITGIGLSSALGNVSSYRFLKKRNKFTAYYGFSQSEVNCLFEKSGIPKVQREEAKRYYNGYHSEDRKHSMYNPWSITRFIDDGEINNYWVTSGAVEALLPALRSEDIKTEVGDALLLSNQNSYVTCLDTLNESDFYQLHALISESYETNYKPTSKLFFTFMLEQGYLAYHDEDDEGILKIPNQEVKLDLAEKLTTNFEQIYGIRESDKNSCKISFSNLFSAHQTADMTVLITDLKNEIERYVTPLKERNTILNHHILQQIFFFPLFETQYTYLTEIPTDHNKRPDFFLYKEDHGVIIELKYMPRSIGSNNDSKQALRQILETRYYTLFGDTKFFKDSAKTFILIGLSFNSELQVSVHCLSNSKVSEYHHRLTTREGLEKKLEKEDIDKLLTMANVVSFNPV